MDKIASVTFTAVAFAAAAARYLKNDRGEPQDFPDIEGAGDIVDGNLNFKRVIDGSMEDVAAQVTAALKVAGFGVLTTIDLAAKFKEKINKDVAPCLILGACNPNVAYEAYQVNTDIAGLLPCNAVLRETAPGKISVELVKPTAMMAMLGDQGLVDAAQKADTLLRQTLAGL